MSREIKFRGWETIMKVMCEVTKIDNPNMGVQLRGMANGTNFKYVELMQFTGLKDKNRKEIYEGDILRWTSCNPFSLGEIRTVKVSYVEARYWCEGSIHVYLAELLSEEKCEVVGNIYENPELL